MGIWISVLVLTTAERQLTESSCYCITSVVYRLSSSILPSDECERFSKLNYCLVCISCTEATDAYIMMKV